jgi:nicotinamidase-related amidase
VSMDLEPTEASSSALLLLDLQSASVAAVGDGEEVVARTRQALQVARRTGMHVAFTRTGVSKEERGWAPSHSVLSRGSVLVAPDADCPESAIHQQLTPRPGELCIRKTRLSAYHRTDLDDQLTTLGVTTLYVAGVFTSGAVLATVLDSVDRDYRVRVLTDCTADLDRDAQRYPTQTLLACHVGVVTLDGFASMITGARENTSRQWPNKRTLTEPDVAASCTR